MKLLDSNILIYAAAGHLDEVARFIRESSPYISDISRIEVLGFHQITPKEIEIFNAFFDAAVLIPISENVIVRAIDLRQRKSLSLGDSLIAATAIEHRLTLITRNVKDFSWIDGLVVTDPFAAS